MEVAPRNNGENYVGSRGNNGLRSRRKKRKPFIFGAGLEARDCTAMELRERDDRKTHLLTRGNVDGIISAALFLAKDPATKVTFVASGDLAVDVLRKDISSSEFFLVDLGLTPRLIKTLNDKSKTRQKV